jgi:hypothetical protein
MQNSNEVKWCGKHHLDLADSSNRENIQIKLGVLGMQQLF